MSSCKPYTWSKLSLMNRLRRSKPGLRTPPPSLPQGGGSGRALEFREAFRRFDTDGDGKLSSQEQQSFFAWAGDDMSSSSEAVERVMRDHDSDGDGLMDYGDFLRLMEMRKGGEEEEDLRRAFEMFEVEKGSGYITADGLQRVLGRLGEVRSHDECVKMIRAYDLDGNGVLDYQEFHKMMA